MARTALTEEEKKARAEARRAEKEAAEQAEKEKAENARNAELEELREQKAKSDEALAALQKQFEELMERMANLQKPQVIQVAADVPKVHLMWQAEVANDNIISFGEGGRYATIKGKRGEFYMPKTDFSTIIDESVRYYLDNRWLIVLDGLDDDEREAYGVAYQDGEYLDKKAFTELIKIGDGILDIYPKLCVGNKIMVAQRYADAYASGDPMVTREIVVKLNEMSKRKESTRGDFIQIIESMNRKDEGLE